MPIYHVFEEGLSTFATVATGNVDINDLEDARHRATVRFRDGIPNSLLFDLTHLRDCPKIFERSVMGLMRMQMAYRAIDRVGQLLIHATPDSLGYGVGRIYLAQGPQLEWIEVELIDNEEELAERLEALAPVEAAAHRDAEPAYGLVDRFLGVVRDLHET